MVRIKHFAAALVLVAVGIAVPAPLAAAVTGVDPGAVELTLAPGASSSFAANVTTPAVAPSPDIVFLADTTGSMDPALANVRNNLRSIMADVRAAQPDARFGVAAYKEQADGDRVFRVNTNLTSDEDLVVAGAQNWLYDVGGGGQPQTDFLNAHYQLATGAVAFRPRGTRVIAWFGDARSNDPSLGHTLADTVNVLRANGIRVVAVPVTGTTAPGLDELGQATSITNGTGGVLMPSQGAGEVATAILNGVQALTVTVAAVPSCAPQLTLTTDPTTRTVRGGTTASFTETVSVKPDAAAGTYQCTVDFQVNGLSVGYTQTVTVHVPGTQPALRISDVTVDEGDSGTTPATLTVSLDRAASQPVSVGWATVTGTARDDDFATGSGTLTFAPGETSRQITVPVAGDRSFEQAETFGITLSEPAGATVVDGSAVVTVDNDDVETPSEVTVDDVSVLENAGPAVLTVRLSAARAEPLTVGLATRPGSATAPADYTAVDTTVTFAPGETQVPVEIVDDTSVEGAETFTAEVSGGAAAVVTIVDNDGAGDLPVVSVADASVCENRGPAVFAVTLTKAAAAEVTVRWTTTAGTADSADFTAGSGQVTFAPGETEARVEVPVTDDSSAEGDETFTLTLSDPSGAALGDADAVGTILDDDDDAVRPSVSVADTSVREDAGPAGFEVRLSEPTDDEVTVTWATGDGTAVAPADYTAASGTVVFTPGQVSALVPVPIVNDTQYEGDETFTLTLSGARIGDGTAVGTVVDDETAVPGTFSCTASAAELLGTRPAVANPGGTPCVDDTRTAARAGLGLGLLTVRVDGLTASTDAAPGGMSATAGMVTTRISTIGLVVEIGAVTSSATMSCAGGLTPVFSGSSSIVSLTVNGVAMPIGSGPVTVPLLVGSLTLNSTVASADGLTQRAFDFRTVLGRVVIGESSVGVTGNPCR